MLKNNKIAKDVREKLENGKGLVSPPHTHKKSPHSPAPNTATKDAQEFEKSFAWVTECPRCGRKNERKSYEYELKGEYVNTTCVCGLRYTEAVVGIMFTDTESGEKMFGAIIQRC